MESQSNQVLVLNVNAAKEEVHCSLGSAIRCDRVWDVLGSGDSCDTRRDVDELWLLGCFQQGKSSLKQVDWTGGIDIDMLK